MAAWLPCGQLARRRQRCKPRGRAGLQGLQGLRARPALTSTWTCFIDHRCNMHESLARGPRNTFSSSGSSGSSALGLRLELVRPLQRLWRLVGLALRVEVVRLRPLQRLWRMALQRLWRMVGLALPFGLARQQREADEQAYRPSLLSCAPCLLQQREADQQ